MPGLVANAQNPNAGVSVPETHRTTLSTSYDIYDEEGNNIGFVQSFGPSHNRPTTIVRHINSADAGRGLEQAPGVETMTISVQGFALYNKQNDGSVVQRIGGSSTRKAMRQLAEQSIPFTIIETVTHPATGEVVDRVSYNECWLTSKNKTINIGNATVQETANISVTWVGE